MGEIEKKHNSVFDSKKGRTFSSKKTLCESLRCIYDICVEKIYKKDNILFKEIVRELEDAFIAGVKMNKKLAEYKLDISDNLDDISESDKEKILERRKERIRLSEMIKENKEIIDKYDV